VLSPLVGIVPWLQEGCQSRLAGSVSIEEFSEASRLAEICIQLPVKWGKDKLSSLQIGRGVYLTTHMSPSRRSCNHCCSGKAMSVTYLRVCLSL